MKKTLCIFLTAILFLCLCSCTNEDVRNTNRSKYKIAVFTADFSENKESFEKSRDIKQAYEDTLIVSAYPHNHEEEPVQIVSIVSELAANPAVKVIIFADAVDGIAAAIEKVRETRSDILIITDILSEQATELAPLSDVCFVTNPTSSPSAIINQSRTMGAKNFVFLTCADDLENSDINAHQELLKEFCSENDIGFIQAIAPNPTAIGGAATAQAWVNENLPRFVEQYGVNTAFYTTNCSLLTPLIRQVAELHAIFPQQCHPSPYHGYPQAFDLDILEYETDTPHILNEIKSAINSSGNHERMACWSCSPDMTVLEAAVQYSIRWCDGNITDRCDRSALNAEIKKFAGNDVQISGYTDEKIGWIGHSFVIQDQYYIF